MLEPATASFAHRKIGLPATAQIFDVSNACLGFLNSLTIAAGLIEAGQIRCAMVVAGENGRPLVEQTLRTLVERPLSRNEIKPYFANLTIGSGAVGAIVCHRSLVKARAHRLLGGVARAATQHSELCQGDTYGAESLAMQTDSEQLLLAGVALARETWTRFHGGARCRVRSFHLPPSRQRAPSKTVRDARARSGEGFLDVRNARQHGSVALPATLAAAIHGQGQIEEDGRLPDRQRAMQVASAPQRAVGVRRCPGHP